MTYKQLKNKYNMPDHYYFQYIQRLCPTDLLLLAALEIHEHLKFVLISHSQGDNITKQERLI